MLFALIVILHVVVSLIIIGLVLLQAGKGADIGSAFGGGGSQAVFGSMVFAVAALVAGALLGIPALIAPKRLSRVKLEPFECGKDPIALPEGRFAIKFSTIAIFFIIFDIELIFIWPWATLYRQLGWFGFGEMMVFLGILMLGFLYIWRKKGLVWE